MAWIYADEEQADGFKWAAYSMYPSELLSFLQVSEINWKYNSSSFPWSRMLQGNFKARE